ncbi:MAG: hypothetical protein L6R40_002497 [Gallowayella cf. fulva]|nr:MAG: hypothetical protein L6R40_002497 [Xanthomendoza cf. fulva]
MSAQKGSEKPASQTKKFGKGEREVPHHTQKAKKFYPAEDESKPKKVRKSIKPARPRPSLVPGSVLILLAGRFRGKRVILLKHLPQGVLLVTGPFKVNGVPLRRVNARYVIATSVKVDLKGIDEKVVEKVGEEGYFTREKKNDKVGEEAFFKQGEKPEKKKVASARASDQKAVDKTLLTNIKKEPMLLEYLRSSFSLRKGDRPHEMKCECPSGFKGFTPVEDRPKIRKTGTDRLLTSDEW